MVVLVVVIKIIIIIIIIVVVVVVVVAAAAAAVIVAVAVGVVVVAAAAVVFVVVKTVIVVAVVLLAVVVFVVVAENGKVKGAGRKNQNKTRKYTNRGRRHRIGRFGDHVKSQTCPSCTARTACSCDVHLKDACTSGVGHNVSLIIMAACICNITMYSAHSV